MKAIAAAAALLSTLAFAQAPQSPPPAAPVDAATRAKVIDAALDALQKSYVFPEVAAKMADDIRARQSRNEYDALDESRAFARKLTEDLQAVSRDKHLRVQFGTPPGASAGGATAN